MGAIEPGHRSGLVQHGQLRERGVEQAVLRPGIGLPGVGMDGMRHELLAAGQDLQRQPLATSERRGSAIDQHVERINAERRQREEEAAQQPMKRKPAPPPIVFGAAPIA
jgi:hypothetical protein